MIEYPSVPVRVDGKIVGHAKLVLKDGELVADMTLDPGVAKELGLDAALSKKLRWGLPPVEDKIRVMTIPPEALGNKPLPTPLADSPSIKKMAEDIDDLAALDGDYWVVCSRCSANKINGIGLEDTDTLFPEECYECDGYGYVLRRDC